MCNDKKKNPKQYYFKVVTKPNTSTFAKDSLTLEPSESSSSILPNCHREILFNNAIFPKVDFPGVSKSEKKKVTVGAHCLG